MWEPTVTFIVSALLGSAKKLIDTLAFNDAPYSRQNWRPMSNLDVQSTVDKFEEVFSPTAIRTLWQDMATVHELRRRIPRVIWSLHRN